MARFYKINSFTNPAKQYTVRHLDSGEWRCDCPLFVFNERKMNECKHIKEAKRIKELQNTNEQTGRDRTEI